MNIVRAWYIAVLALIAFNLSIARHLPYPIILLHGFNSNDIGTWSPVMNDFQSLGLFYGGRFDFCLNADGHLETARSDSDIREFTALDSLRDGDYYTVNFDVSPVGAIYSNQVESSEAAITKQGIALGRIVRHVLDITGRENVILVGHSMGGLAAREYVQNPAVWQNDGMHHVAKIVTIGTPHGGTQISTFGLFGDDYSEAIRDMRQHYPNETKGIYLFGGGEQNLIGQGFHNNDVNCNGAAGDSIIGLNQRPLPTEPSYVCVIGTAGGNTDGVVDSAAANLNNLYPSSVADTLIVPSWHTASLASLHGQSGNYETGHADVVLSSLDEPSSLHKAYRIELDSGYHGMITKPPGNAADKEDIDMFRFTVPGTGSIHLSIGGIAWGPFTIRLFDPDSTPAFSFTTSGEESIDTSVAVSGGIHYLAISAMPDDAHWHLPYQFSVGYTPGTSVYENAMAPARFVLSQNYPNPFNPITTIGYRIADYALVTLKIFDPLGREVTALVNGWKAPGEYSVNFDGTNLASGLYYYRMTALRTDNGKPSASNAVFTDMKKFLMIK